MNAALNNTRYGRWGASCWVMAPDAKAWQARIQPCCHLTPPELERFQKLRRMPTETKPYFSLNRLAVMLL
jgi:hypothetical protein